MVVAVDGASVAIAAPPSVVACDAVAVGVGAGTGVRGTVNVRNRLPVAVGVVGGAAGPRRALDVV
jgi:hypothetical protein